MSEITIFKPEDNRSIGALLKGSSIKPEKFLAIAQRVWSEKFRDCDPKSFLESVQSIASIGLNPDPLTKQVWLIPFKDKTGKKNLQLIVGYQGFVTLMRRAKCKQINCDVVYEGDKFSYELGSEPHLKHTKKLSRDRGAPIATWASCKIDGETILTVLTEQDIDRIRASSRGAEDSSSPWKKHTDEMRKKSALRRLSKLIPYTAFILILVIRYRYFSRLIGPGDFSNAAGVSDVPQELTLRRGQLIIFRFAFDCCKSGRSPYVT